MKNGCHCDSLKNCLSWSPSPSPESRVWLLRSRSSHQKVPTKNCSLVELLFINSKIAKIRCPLWFCTREGANLKKVKRIGIQIWANISLIILVLQRWKTFFCWLPYLTHWAWVLKFLYVIKGHKVCFHVTLCLARDPRFCASCVACRIAPDDSHERIFNKALTFSLLHF